MSDYASRRMVELLRTENPNGLTGWTAPEAAAFLGDSSEATVAALRSTLRSLSKSGNRHGVKAVLRCQEPKHRDREAVWVANPDFDLRSS